MTTQASFRQHSTPPRWENINRTTGFVSPPRFQQLRNQQRHQQPEHNQGYQQQPGYQHQQEFQQQQEYQQQQYQPPQYQQQQPQVPQQQAPQQQNYQNQLQFPSIKASPPMAPISSQSPQPRPPLQNHGNSRSSTFFSFRSNKQSLESKATPPALGNGKSNTLPPPASQPQKLQRPPPTQQAQPKGPPPPQVQSLPSPQFGNMQQQQQQSTPAAQTSVVRQPSMQGKAPVAAPPPLHPEIRSVVQLTVAHAHKIYFSGPLVRRIERQPDGHRPAKDDGWTDVWAQLGGTTLSIWDMKEIQEASKQGKEVPPAYVNVTDAFVQVLGSVTVPATANAPSKRYTNVLTINTAGSNLLLFSCPSTQALISWAAALRLSAWEKSRLEEIYTAHLIRITLSTRDSPSTLIRGRMEGWVRVRIAGQTDWKRVWVVVTAGTEGTGHGPSDPSTPSSGIGAVPAPPPLPAPKKKRMSSLFSRDVSGPSPTAPTKSTIAMYTSPKPKDKKKPLLTMRDVTQVFAVYPERPELISRSTLIKVEGMLGDEEMAGTMKVREGWVLVMPELEGGAGQAAEMLKWVVGLHDAFELYGRPEAWTWDPRDPVSLMFAYPVGPYKDLLFLDREPVEALDPRDDRTSAIRSRLLSLLLERIRGNEQRPTVQAVPSRTSTSDAPPTLPPIGNGQQQQNGFPSSSSSGSTTGPQLPPLSFSSGPSPADKGKAPLTPITERSSVNTHGRTLSMDAPSMLSPGQSSLAGTSPPPPPPPAVADKPDPTLPTEHRTLLDRPLSLSPAPGSANGGQSPTFQQQQATRPSFEYGGQTGGRPSFDNGARPLFDNGTRPSFDNGARPSFDGGRPSFDAPFPVRPLSPIKQGGSTPDLTHRNSSSPANVQLPSSPPSISQSPPSFTASRPSMDRNNSSQVNSPTPPKSPDSDHLQSPSFLQRQGSGDPRSRSPSISILTSPHSIGEEPRTKTQDTFFSDRSSLLTSPHSPEPRRQSLGDRLGDRSSILTSPHSINDEERRTPLGRSADRSSVLTFPYSPEAERRAQAGGATSPQMFSHTNPITQVAPQAEDSGDFFNEAGALYFMQQSEGGAPTNKSPHRPLPSISNPTDPTDNDSDSSDDYGSTKPSIPPASSSQNAGGSSPVADHNLTSNRSPPARRSTPMAFVDRPSHTPAPNSRSGLGRKPSGARAPASSRPYNGGSISSHQQLTEEEELHSDNDSMNVKRDEAPRNLHDSRDEQVEHPDADVLAALSYLDVEDSRAAESSTSSKANTQLLNVRSDASSPAAKSPVGAPKQEPQQFKSSFAPSKQAAERKAKVQAQQAAHHAAVHKPGRANGNRKSRIAGAWAESSDEEEEEEDEDEDDEADSDAEPPLTRGQNTPSSELASSNASTRMPQDRGQGADAQAAYSNARPSRTLPQIPGNRPLPDDHPLPPRRIASDQYSEARRTHYDEGPQIRTQAEMPKPGAARQTMWSQVLDPRAPGAPPANQLPSRDTFVQLDPAETMTKAFTPQGLLSAGLQDKDDRSAKRQEELARETGASLINVPHKPQPPQTGLLGAITAHERERKREGGVGAALTEREREKRVVEERQRRFDEQQRQQMEQMQQTGSMYGTPYPNFNPMMGNPMMMGMNPMMMNPMMTGGGIAPMMSGGGMAPMMSGGAMTPMMTGQMGQMGYPGMMPGFNPQHMFAAQQAAQAYQQAMMAFSVAGSQVGGDAGGTPSQLNSNMTGGGMGAMDPRMSMMGMPMMGGNQMGGQMGTPMPLGMQMTGMSGFDPRFSPGITPGMGNSPTGMNNSTLLPPMGPNNQNPGQFSTSRNSSPAGRGSPLARPGNDQQPENNRPSRSASPKH